MELSIDQVVEQFGVLLEQLSEKSEYLLDNEIVGELYEIGTLSISTIEGAINVLKLVQKISSIPSKLFFAKVERYIRGATVIPVKKRERYIKNIGKEKYNKDNIRILCIINHIEEMKKIDMMVKLFAAKVNEEIDNSKYFRLVNLVERTLYDDLIYMKEHITTGLVKINNESEEGLCTNGLLRYAGEACSTETELGGIVYKYSESAKQICKYVFDMQEIENSKSDIKQIVRYKIIN